VGLSQAEIEEGIPGLQLHGFAECLDGAGVVVGTVPGLPDQLVGLGVVPVEAQDVLGVAFGLVVGMAFQGLAPPVEKGLDPLEIYGLFLPDHLFAVVRHLAALDLERGGADSLEFPGHRVSLVGDHEVGPFRPGGRVEESVPLVCLGSSARVGEGDSHLVVARCCAVFDQGAVNAVARRGVGAVPHVVEFKGPDRS